MSKKHLAIVCSGGAALIVLGWVLFMLFRPLSTDCAAYPERVVNSLIPDGAIWTKETVRRVSAPTGYTAVSAWINAATVRSCIDEKEQAQIVLRAVRIIEHPIDGGEEHVVKEVIFENGDAGDFEGKLFPRLPKWFGEGTGSGWQSIAAYRDHYYYIDLARASQRIFHAWTNPRLPARSDAVYIVEVEAKIIGRARLQLGVDYWRNIDAPYNGYSDDCTSANNCEGWISDWYGDSGGAFVTLRAPKAF